LPVTLASSVGRRQSTVEASPSYFFLSYSKRFNRFVAEKNRFLDISTGGPVTPILLSTTFRVGIDRLRGRHLENIDNNNNNNNIHHQSILDIENILSLPIG